MSDCPQHAYSPDEVKYEIAREMLSRCEAKNALLLSIVTRSAAVLAKRLPTDGYRSVPLEPTYEMVQTGAKVVKDNLPYHTGTLAIYKAMVEVAPASPDTQYWNELYQLLDGPEFREAMG